VKETKMKKLFVSILLLSLAVQGALAQSVPSATAPRYVKPYVDKGAQFDAMRQRPASAPAVYGANPASTPSADGSRIQNPVNTGSQTHRAKRAHSRVASTTRSASAAAGDPYSNDLWNAGQTYASPETSDPYSAH
jgi:hypothetical protein